MRRKIWLALALWALPGCGSNDSAESPASEDAGSDTSAASDTSVVDTSTTDTINIDSGSETTPVAPPKRIVFFLGDGMGLSVMTAARIYGVGEDGSLAMDDLPETGFVRTYSNDSMVTDSAAAMTAYMTGVKCNNDVLSMSADTPYKGTTGSAVTTFLELAEKAGFSTGVVTTTRVTHATPAATYAHISDRDKEEDIAKQLVPGGAGYNSALLDGLEVVFGGGQKQFATRGDARNLVDELKAKGYAYASDKTSFDAIPDTTTKALGLFTSSHMSYDLDRDPAKEPSLADMSLKAVRILKKNAKGFFLMVEGGRIDHALHETNARRALQDTIAFDAALKATLDELRKDDPTLANTLVVVTADHDHTMVLNGYAKRTGKTTDTNPGVLGLVKDYVTGVPTKDSDGAPYAILGFGNGEHRVSGSRSSLSTLTDTDTFAKDYHQEAAIKMPAGGETHGGTDVFIGAIGMGADKFHGFMTNVDVFPILKSMAGL